MTKSTRDIGPPQPEGQSVVGGLLHGLQRNERSTLEALGQGHALRLAAIVESSDDAIISKDLNGIIATWNRGAERLFGYRADEVIGRSITILFPPELVCEEDDILARIRRGQPIEHYETVRRRKDGRRVAISLTVSPILGGDGQIIGASKVARDISARKRAESTQSALYELTDQLFRAKSAGDIHNAALDAIIRALDCQRASVLLFDEAGIMKFVAWRGLSEGYRRAAEGHSPWTPDSRDPEPICVNEIGTADIDAALKATIRAEGIAALAFIPVCANGRVIGKFMAYYSTPHPFDDADRSIAVTIARQLGFGLERLHAEKSRREAAETKQLLLDESRHRVKNMLATVQAIAGQTLRHASPADLEAFLARLRALGEAHELLSMENWHQASLSELIHRALKPFMDTRTERFDIRGPAIQVPASTSLHLTLCLHELATNATKYGALSNGAGQVRLSWLADDNRQRLELRWEETGGPPVTPPKRKGFGTLLIRSGGQTDTRLDFAPEGLKCILDIRI